MKRHKSKPKQNPIPELDDLGIKSEDFDAMMVQALQVMPEPKICKVKARAKRSKKKGKE